MNKMKSVKKFVSQLSLVVLSCILFFSNLGIAFTSQTSGRVRQGTVEKRSQGNILSLTQFNSELSKKVRESQKVAAFSSLENAKSQSRYKADGSKSILSGAFFLTQSESLIKPDEGKRSLSRSIMMITSANVTETFSLTGQISGSQDVRNPESAQSNGVSDLGLILSQKPIELSSWLKGGFNVSSYLPTSEYSQRYQQFQGSIGSSYAFSIPDGVLAKGLTTSLSIGASRSFHRFETDKAGNILNPYSLREIFSASYSKGSFSFSFEFKHRHAWNYKNDIKQSFEHTQQLGYSVTKQWGVAVGHTNGGSWLAPNGVDSNLKLVDDKNSIAYVSTSVAF